MKTNWLWLQTLLRKHLYYSKHLISFIFKLPYHCRLMQICRCAVLIFLSLFMRSRNCRNEWELLELVVLHLAHGGGGCQIPLRGPETLPTPLSRVEECVFIKQTLRWFQNRIQILSLYLCRRLPAHWDVIYQPRLSLFCLFRMCNCTGGENVSFCAAVWISRNGDKMLMMALKNPSVRELPIRGKMVIKWEQ